MWHLYGIATFGFCVLDAIPGDDNSRDTGFTFASDKGTIAWWGGRSKSTRALLWNWELFIRYVLLVSQT